MCTDMILPFEGENPTIISGRTTDMNPSPTVSYPVYKVPMGVQFTAMAPGEKAGKTWTTQYGYVGAALHFTKDGDDQPVMQQGFLEGMNQEGLSVAALDLPYTEYVNQVAESDYDKCVDANSVVQFLLGTCTTVDEVQTALGDVIVWYPKAWQMLNTLHLSVHDAAGGSLVVEFVDGEKKFYANTIGVLANEPTYDWHTIHFYYSYNALTNADTPVDKYVRMTKDQQGRYVAKAGGGYQNEVLSSGMFGLPGDSSSPSRFARAGKLRACVPTDYDGHTGVQYALQVLDRLAVCTDEDLLYYNMEGKPQEPRNVYNSTLWRAVRDHTNRIWYCCTSLNHNLQAIKLADLDFSAGSPVTHMPMQNDQWYTDVTAKLN